MAKCTPNFVKQLLAVSCAGGQRGRFRAIHEAHELGEHKPGWHDFQGIVVKLWLGAGNIKRFVDYIAGGIFTAADRKFIIADAHLHVVGLASKYSDRTILRLPSETADGSVVRNHVGMTGDPEITFSILVGIHVGA